MNLCIRYATDISAFSQPYPMVTKRRRTKFNKAIFDTDIPPTSSNEVSSINICDCGA